MGPEEPRKLHLMGNKQQVSGWLFHSILYYAQNSTTPSSLRGCATHARRTRPLTIKPSTLEYAKKVEAALRMVHELLRTAPILQVSTDHCCFLQIHIMCWCCCDVVVGPCAFMSTFFYRSLVLATHAKTDTLVCNTAHTQGPPPHHHGQGQQVRISSSSPVFSPMFIFLF